MTLKWKRNQTYGILMKTRRFKVTEGYASDNKLWGIHATEDKGWRLTHLPTGRMICSFDTLKAAKDMAARAQETGIEWATLTEFDNHARARLLKERYRVFVKHIKGRRKNVRQGTQED